MKSQKVEKILQEYFRQLRERSVKNKYHTEIDFNIVAAYLDNDDSAKTKEHIAELMQKNPELLNVIRPVPPFLISQYFSFGIKRYAPYYLTAAAMLLILFGVWASLHRNLLPIPATLSEINIKTISDEKKVIKEYQTRIEFSNTDRGKTREYYREDSRNNGGGESSLIIIKTHS